MLGQVYHGLGTGRRNMERSPEELLSKLNLKDELAR